MVWHSFLLSPKMFAAHCETYAQTRIRKVPFPWASVVSLLSKPRPCAHRSDSHQHAAINHADWSFALPKRTSVTAHLGARLDGDLFAFLARWTMAPALDTILWKCMRRGDAARAAAVLAANPALLPNEQTFARCCIDALAGHPLNRRLADAVKRQVAFVDQMDAQLWIRSPALAGTLQRAGARYARFLRLLQLYPGTTLVPTLDVDLAWHTHQLSHHAYRAAVEARVGRFVDHDDKIGRATLDDGMAATEKLWRVRFGEEYRVCQCWDCEALRSAPEMGPGEEADEAVLDQIMADVRFHRAVELARRNGKPLPARREASGSQK